MLCRRGGAVAWRLCCCQTVLAELQKLKVAVSVKQVHNAALELRHAKRVMELQSVLKRDRVRGCCVSRSRRMLRMVRYLANARVLWHAAVRVCWRCGAQDEARAEFDTRIEEGGKLLAEEVGRAPGCHGWRVECTVTDLGLLHGCDVGCNADGSQVQADAARCAA